MDYKNYHKKHMLIGSIMGASNLLIAIFCIFVANNQEEVFHTTINYVVGVSNLVCAYFNLSQAFNSYKECKGVE